MIDAITWFIPRIFTLYFMIITFLAGAICYFSLYPSLKKDYPIESKIAEKGGLIYMIIGPLLYFIVKLFF